MMTYEENFKRISRSKFRSQFHLSAKDIAYIDAKGMDTIRKHCEDFIASRLSPANIPNDGAQTPMRGHPVFVAQHACACCCRGCLENWYHVKKGVALTPLQETKIVNLLMKWIERAYSFRKALYK